MTWRDDLGNALADVRSTAGASVTYQRASDTVIVTAVRGRSSYMAESAVGIVYEVESVDYLVAAAALILDGATVTPQAGDLIVDGDETFEVMAAGGSPPFEPSDPDATTLRIHTRPRESA